MRKLLKLLKLKVKLLQLRLKLLLKQRKVEKIIIHHAADTYSFNQVNNYHKNKWHFKSKLGYYIGYTYYITRDGVVKQGRKDTEEGAHTLGQNKGSIGISLSGNGVREDFTEVQYKSLEELVSKKLNEYNLEPSDIYPHSYFSATKCPSDFLRDWIKNYPND